MPLPDEPTKPQPRKEPKRRDPLHDPPPQPLQDPPDQPLHDPEGDPTREPQQPFGDPTPSPASDPLSQARAILIFNSRQQSGRFGAHPTRPALIFDARVQMALALSGIEFGLSLIELCDAL